ncbi:MAG: phage holin family protein [Planctomycetaceae bacterium]
MSYQTTMNGRKPSETPASQVGSNLAGLTHDLITLGELQLQLIGVDLREGLSKGLLPGFVIFSAVLLALGTMPVILLGIGWSLHNLVGFSIGATFLMVSMVALAVSGLSGWWGFRSLMRSFATMKRSQSELAENLRWVKAALTQQNTRSELYRQRL